MIQIPDYRPLQAGETIQEGDEAWTLPSYRGRHVKKFATWEPVYALIGKIYYGDGVRFRRPIAPVTGRDVYGART